MHQLPSGRYVDIRCQSPEAISKSICDSNPAASIFEICRAIERVNTVEALKPYVRIVLAPDLSQMSQALPENEEICQSEFTLANQEQFTADWPDNDKEAFKDFLVSEKAKSLLHDCLRQMIKFSHETNQSLSHFLSSATTNCCGLDGESDECRV